ncbi:MAG: hypothetical protein CMP10_20250 [Zetaproteobacteria bacterium]|nr:hypothetical protein [Pseudobdellovibrionaceae bacterium]|tara:strand:+ start:366 stop:1085 length:720 start_codon:yes stop_codon:yes gene_type:complete
MKPIMLAHDLMARRFAGVLSTNSLEYEGFPFGSLTPFCLNHKAEPLIMISDLAQHTKNIKADPRVSLMIPEDLNHGDPQTQGRVSYLGHAEVVDEPIYYDQYTTFFPQSKDYSKTHDFEIYRIRFEAIRFIGGFGKIYWLNAKSWSAQNHFHPGDVAPAVDHMNDDHKDALVEYLQYALEPADTIDPDKAKLIHVDPYGFHISYDETPVRLAFLAPLEQASDLRHAFVSLLKSIRQGSN